MDKKILIMHGVWAAVVAGAFLVGDALSRGQAKVTEVTDKQPRPVIRAIAGGPVSKARFPLPPTRASGFAAEMAAVMAEPDERLRANRANRLINGLNPGVLAGLTEEMVPNLMALFQDVRYTPGVSVRTLDAYKAFVGAWARLDPPAAAAHMADRSNNYWINPRGEGEGTYDSLEISRAREAAREAAIAEWAKVDLAAAKAFALSVENKTAREHSLMGLMKHLAGTDIDGAIAWSAELEAARGDAGKRLEVPYLVSQLTEQRGQEGVNQWLAGVEHVARDDGTLSYKQSAVIAMGEGIRKAARAIGWAEEYVDFLKENANEPFLTAELLTENGWTPRYCLDLILQLPEEIAPRREAVGDEFQKLLNEDFKYAGQWLRKQELAPVHDEAIQVYVREATKDDILAAMRWAEQISDPVLRAETIRYVQERGGK